MHAMQYAITLPADYDMRIIRHRVASRGHLLDAFPGLGLKAYAIRERGTGGSDVHQYAPFYLWRTAEGMNSFLWGAGFRGIIADFGRPVVQHWAGLAYEPGPAHTVVPRAAARHTAAIPPGADPAGAIDEALGELRTLAGAPGAHSAALAVDPRHWELVRFSLWEETAPEEAGDRYEVLHLSAPGAHDLTPGRHW